MKVESPKCNGEGPREESRVCPSLMEALNWASRNTSENDSLYDLDSDTPDEAESEKAIAVADQQYENITLEMEPPRAIPVVFKLSPMYRDTPVRTGLLPGESESDVASYSDDEHPVSFINLFKSPFYPYRQHSIAITAADRPYIKDPASVPDEKDRAEWELISAQYQTHEVVVDDGTDLGKVCSPTSLIGDDYECPRVPKLTVKDRFPRSYVNNDPLLLVNPNTLDPLPNCVGNRMKINRSKVNRKNKAYSRIYYVIPDLSVRFSALMASLKVSGFEELRLSSVLNICGNSGKKRPSGACSGASNSDKVNQKTTAALRSLYSQEEISYRHVIRAGMTHEEKIDALSQHARNKLVSTPLWSLRWCKRMKSDEYSIMAPHQKVNHFPATWGIGRKDNLHRHLKAFSDKHGDDNYFFFPQAFLLPQDALILKKDMKLRTHCPPGQSKNVYIVKQVASACGRGMKLLQNSPHLPKGPWVVQRYIHDPYLIAGLKFDLRIYVVVTSFNPLRVYMYEDGLVRFATSPYPTANKECLDDEVDVNSMNSFGDTSADGIPPIPTKRKKGEGKKSNKSPSFKINEISAHLTNYSVNRHADNFIQPECDGTDNNNDDDDDDDDDPDQKGSKWVISTLKRYLENKCNIPFAPIWESIVDVIIKTLISVESDVNAQMRTLFATCSTGAPTKGKKLVPSAGRTSGIGKTLPHSALVHRAGSGVNNCFELYGFDILLRDKPMTKNTEIDNNRNGAPSICIPQLTPVLMEVNIMPSLHTRSTILDQRVKANAMADMLSLVGIYPSCVKKAFRNGIPIPCQDPAPYVCPISGNVVGDDNIISVSEMKRERQKSTDLTPVCPYIGGMPSWSCGPTSQMKSSIPIPKRQSTSMGDRRFDTSNSQFPLENYVLQNKSKYSNVYPFTSSSCDKTSLKGVMDNIIVSTCANTVNTPTETSSNYQRNGNNNRLSVTSTPSIEGSRRYRALSSCRGLLPRNTLNTLEAKSGVKRPSGPKPTDLPNTNSPRKACLHTSPSIYDAHPFFKTCTPVEVDVICQAEEELARRTHWTRIFPPMPVPVNSLLAVNTEKFPSLVPSTSLGVSAEESTPSLFDIVALQRKECSTGLPGQQHHVLQPSSRGWEGYKAFFAEPRPYNTLLATWEAVKWEEWYATRGKSKKSCSRAGSSPPEASWDPCNNFPFFRGQKRTLDGESDGEESDMTDPSEMLPSLVR